jgi:hypothetical protein
MARYRKLLALELTHEYLGGSALGGLRYVPSAACAALMARERLVWRTLPAGVELWQEDGPAASADEWQLGLDIYAGDPLLRFCTAWPDGGALAVEPGSGAAVQVLRLAALAAPAEARGPLLWLDLACRPLAPVPAAALQPWRVALGARRLHWKYFFSGALAGKQLSIIDLDASDSEPGIRFAPSPMAATANGTAYLSASPLPMQSLPTQRLQLREAGTAGKVLIRRLPNASVDKLGKEQGPNGQSMIVAEIYVHQ